MYEHHELSPIRHTAVHRLKVSVHPSVLLLLKCLSFLTYHRPPASSVVIELNNVSGRVNKRASLSLSLSLRLQQSRGEVCTHLHKQTQWMGMQAEQTAKCEGRTLRRRTEKVLFYL